ncbi:MAG: helix-turn-helix domain-containing protein [Arcobacteraceae bacterium]
MTRLELINKIKHRKQELHITIENLALLSGIGIRTLNRFLAGDDVKLSTVEKITSLLGLDFAGNEIISLDKLKEQRAREKAIFMASLVQSTSALEKQGLEQSSLDKIIHKFEQEFLSGQYQDRLWVADNGDYKVLIDMHRVTY